MKTEITIEEAKAVISKFPKEDDFIQAHFQQFMDRGYYDDNSISLSNYWNKCKKIIDSNEE